MSSNGSTSGVPESGLYPHVVDRGSHPGETTEDQDQNILSGAPARNKPIYERCVVKRGGADFGSRAPAHPLRLRLRSIWPISDPSADELVVQPATHPLSPRPRESCPSLRTGSVRSVGRRDLIRSTIYSGSTDRSDVAITPESKGRHHSPRRQSAMGP